MTERRPLAALFDPSSFVVIGASNDPNRIGGRPIAYSRRHGYRGRIYAINPRRAEVQGLRAYPDVASLPEVPEVAMITVPGGLALDAVASCAQAGVRAAVVASSGFAEVGEDGRRLQEQMVAAARAGGMRLVGPNTQGLATFTTGAMLNFSTTVRTLPPPLAPIAVCSQSGSMAVVPYALLRQRGIGVRHAHATGNEADVTVAELAAEIAREPGMRLLLLYLETVRDAAPLAELGAVAREHGVAVLTVKAGRSLAGQHAARSHTGALANEDRTVDAFLARHGILRVRDSAELVAAAELYLKDWQPAGSHTVILSQSGASCVQAADAAVETGLPLAALAPATIEALGAILPPFAVSTNPVDLTGALINDNSLFSKVLPVLAADPGVQATVIALPLIGEGYDLATLAADAAQAAAGLPVVAGVVDPEATAAFRAAGVPTVATEVEAVAALRQYLAWHALVAGPVPPPPCPPVPAVAGTPLDEAAALRLLATFGVPVVPHRLCSSEEEAAAAFRDFGPPLVAKGCSARAIHKSELGLVALGLGSEAALRHAYRRIRAALGPVDPEAPVLVAPMVAGRHELMAGARHDPVFGPLLVVGDGGTAVEALEDIEVLLLPTTDAEILAAVGRLRVAPLLGALRGKTPADLSGFAAAARALGAAIADPRAGITEIDCNPVIVGASGPGIPPGAVAVDAAVFVAGAAPSPPPAGP